MESRRQPRRFRQLTTVLVVACLITVGCSSNRGAQRGKRGFEQSGIASWYGPGFDGNLTANGERYDMNAMTAAHKQLPFGTVVEVRNRDNGERIRVRINDRGPFVRKRIIDLSKAAAAALGMLGSGIAKVTIRVIEPGDGRTFHGRSSPAGNTRAGDAFLVQAGAFRHRDAAERQLRAVRKVFSNATLVFAPHAAGDDTGWHRIVLGPFDSAAKAHRTAADLEQHGHAALVRRIDPGQESNR